MTPGAYDDARAHYANDYMVLRLQRRALQRHPTGTRRKTDSPVPVKRYDAKGNRIIT